MRMTKKITSIVLAALMVMSLFVAVPATASATTTAYVKVTSAPSDWLVSRFLAGIQDWLSDMRSPYFLVMWAVVALIFLALLIFAPKAATVMEFVFGIYFIFLAFKFNYVNPLGIALIISVCVFLFFKVLFLIVNIMYKVEYGYDDVERGESGRRVRKSDSDFFFG